MNRKQMVEALRAKLEVSLALPILSEGATYAIEFSSGETVVIAKLHRIIDDAPLGRGFSFQLPTKRIFVYERDLRPGPDRSLIVMGSC